MAGNENGVCCICNYPSTDTDNLVNVTNKGIKTIIGFARYIERHDLLELMNFASTPDEKKIVLVHADCRRDFTNLDGPKSDQMTRSLNNLFYAKR